MNNFSSFRSYQKNAAIFSLEAYMSEGYRLTRALKPDGVFLKRHAYHSMIELIARKFFNKGKAVIAMMYENEYALIPAAFKSETI